MRKKICGMFVCLLTNILGLHAAAQPSCSQEMGFVTQSASQRYMPSLQQLASKTLITHPAHVAQHLDFIQSHPDLKYVPAQTINNALLARIGFTLVRSRLVTKTLQHAPGIAFNSSGTELAIGFTEFSLSGDSGRIKIFDTETGKLLRTLPGNQFGSISLAFNSDNTILASGTYYGGIILLNSITGEVLHNFEGVSSLAVSSDGTKLASRLGGRVYVWDFATGALLGKYTEPTYHRGDLNTGYVASVALNSDGTILAAGLRTGLVRLWDTTFSIDLHALPHGSCRIEALAFSPDGTILASGGYDKYIKLWNVQTGELLHTFGGFEEIHALAFSPDGTKLASGLAGEQIAVWNTANGNLLHSFPAQTSSVERVAFSSNGLFASDTVDGKVKLWRADYTKDFQTNITDEELTFLLKAAQEWLAGRPYSVIQTYPVYQHLIKRFRYLNDKRLFAPIATPLLRPSQTFRSSSSGGDSCTREYEAISGGPV